MVTDDAPLRNLWYMAGFGAQLASGKLKHQVLLGEPVVFGRGRDGKAFALRDICPHRGVPFSAGKMMADGTVECPYHGWRFGTDGVCQMIPSLVEGQDFDPARIRARAYPVREQDGLIWIYMAADGQENLPPTNEPPKVGIDNPKPRWSVSQTFHCPVDHAVIGLMDPAHAAYVHAHWYWRHKTKAKEKHYAPLPTGFAMTRHQPSKPAYQLLGAEVTTEITFELPSTRFENVEGKLFGRRFKVVSLTLCTPIDAEATQVTQIMYWPAWVGFIRPFFMIFGAAFLGDDRRMVELQRQGLKFNPRLMLIQDADQPAIWYHRVKKAWAESVASRTPFTNPVEEKTLRWRS